MALSPANKPLQSGNVYDFEEMKNQYINNRDNELHPNRNMKHAIQEFVGRIDRDHGKQDHCNFPRFIWHRIILVGYIVNATAHGNIAY